MLSEREAWLKLAKLWTKPDIGSSDCPRVLDWSFGVCHSVDDLRGMNEISVSLADRMREKAQNPKDPDAWRWPLTIAGAKSRAAFCRKMAKLCSRKRKA